jgi:O-antigen ligase
VAPLFFVALAFAFAGSRFGYATFWAFSALALFASAWAGAVRANANSRLAMVVLVFSLWVACHTLLISPAYTPAGLFHPLLFVVAFAAFRRFDDLGERHVGIAALALGGMLAAWGLVQVGPLAIARAHAIFETPATYAAVINLLLVPLLALVLVRESGAPLLALGAALAAASFAAASRGGMLALAAGLGVAVLLAWRSGLMQRRGLIALLCVVTAGWILAGALRMLPAATGTREAAPGEEAQAESSLSRLELYELSWQAWQDRPLVGTGYLTFRHVLEHGRAKVPSYGETAETWFVHNDYLQTLQELGPLGLAGLIALTGWPILLAYRRIPAMKAGDRPAALAAASGLAATACHALVDFPFYVPACLVLYGALLGALERRLVAAPVGAPQPADQVSWRRAVRTGIAVLAGVLLMRPVAAEVSAEWGLRRYADGETQSAAIWLGAARRLEPADWRYHWYAGNLWNGVAIASSNRDAARLASDAFAAGFGANALEVRNLLGLMQVHRQLGALLDAPADRATRAAWVEKAEALAPFDPGVRRERQLLEAGR